MADGSAFPLGIDMSNIVTQTDVGKGNLANSPRIRVNSTATKAAPLVLSPTWQKIDFGGNATLNVNTFPLSSDGINKMVYWDTTAKKFVFMTDVDRNYNISLFLKTTSSSLLNIANLAMATIQIQFVVPNGTSAGVDYKFPFPDDEDGAPGLDLNLINAISPWKQEYFSNTTIDERKRTNGMYVNVRISNVVPGTISLVAANLIFTSK